MLIYYFCGTFLECPMKRFCSLMAFFAWALFASAQDSLCMPVDMSHVESISADAFVVDTLMAEATEEEAYPRVSLLTCSPGPIIWQQYGHTGIRYEDPSENLDIVFNYGLFDFAAPHFVWRFMLGHTDYIVGAEEYPYFELEYMARGSSMTVQVLNLTLEEKKAFLNLITMNCRKENRSYRYNFFYKNCSTMARDILLKSLTAPVSFEETGMKPFREVLHEYNMSYPWCSFGIDLLLGKSADIPVSREYLEFAPAYLMRSFATANCIDDNAERPLVKDTMEVGPVEDQAYFRFPLSPLQMMILVLMLTAIMCTLELLTEKKQWWFDILLYGVQGLAGIVITFLFLFSTHPTVNTNVLVALFNPLIFVLLPLILSREKTKAQWACIGELSLVLLFIVTELIVRQDVPIAAWLFIAALLLRTFHHLVLRNYLSRHLRKSNKK